MNAIRNVPDLPAKVECVKDVNSEGTLYLSELRKASQQKAKAARKAKIEAMRTCVIANSIVTALAVFAVTVLSLTYCYDFRGYFAVGGEIFLICFTAFIVPVIMWELERRWLIE